MSLTTPPSVQKLQTALHDKAKGSPDLRFHALYDKVYRKDVLAFAYECCKANGGAAGVDGQKFAPFSDVVQVSGLLVFPNSIQRWQAIFSRPPNTHAVFIFGERHFLGLGRAERLPDGVIARVLLVIPSDGCNRQCVLTLDTGTIRSVINPAGTAQRRLVALHGW